MSKPKYTLKFSHLLETSGIHKLERDGFTRHDIHDALFKETGDAKAREREDIMSKLYDRKE